MAFIQTQPIILADNTANAFVIREEPGGVNYVEIDTLNGSEVIRLKKNIAIADDGYIGNVTYPQLIQLTSSSSVTVAGNVDCERIIATTAGISRMKRISSSINVGVNTLSILAESTGNMLSGFGPGLTFSIRDTEGIDRQICRILGQRGSTDLLGKITFWTGDSGNYLKMTLDEDGQLTLHGGGDLNIDSDTYGLVLGDGQDARLWYDGTAVRLTADLVAASDFIVDCGTAKTLELAEPVYEDLNFSIGQLRSGVTRPGFVDKRGTGIYQDSFAVGEEVSGSVEIPHGTKLSSVMVPHIRWTADGGDTTGNFQFQITYKITSYDGTAWSTSTTVINTGDIAVSAAWETGRADFISNINNLSVIEAQLELTIERIAAGSDEWAGEIFVSTWGLHHLRDTMGSRTISTK